MKIKSMYPIIITNDVEATEKYYTDILGYSVKHRVETAMKTQILILVNQSGLEMEVMEIPKTGPVASNFGAPGMYGLRVNVDNIEEAFEEIKAKGCTVVSGIIENHLGKCLLIKDNNGVNITLIQHIKK